MARTIGYSATETTITVRVKGLDTSYASDNRYIDWWLYDADGEEIDSIYGTEVEAGASSTPQVTFRGLEPDTEYEVQYELFYSSTETGSLDSSVTGSKTIYTDAPELSIEHFEWDTPKTTDGAFNVTASEWNKLIDKITEVYTYLGWPNYQDTYPIETVSSGDIFYAERFNEVKEAIGNLYSTGISTKSTGDTINADDLNQLVTSLNAKIDNL